MKILDEASGEEIEVYTADEVAVRETAARAAVTAEFEPKLTEATTKLTEAERRAAERSGEFAKFRALSDEQIAALTEKDRIIYENGLALKASEDARIAGEVANKKALVDGVIKAKAGSNQALADKMAEMWPILGVEANTPEQVETKAQMILGALSTSQPDLVASVAGFTGTYAPPGSGDKEGEKFGDTAAGKAFAADLGLTIEAPTK